MASALIIVNPAAGRGRVGKMLPEINRVIDKVARELEGLDVVRKLTDAPGHALELAWAAPAGSRVVAVGGDGTLHEVVGGSARSDKVVGMVPIGSGNDFARMVGVYKLPLEQALRVALSGRVKKFDLPEVNGQPYGNSLGMGFDAEVARKALSAPRMLRGLPRYLYSIFGVLKDLSLPELTLESEGKTLFQGKALLAAVMNGRTYGAGIPIAPPASPTDALLTTVVAGEFSRMGVVGILPRLMSGKHLSHPHIHLNHAASFAVRFNRPVPAHADGELLKPAAVYQVKILPSALQVAVG